MYWTSGSGFESPKNDLSKLPPLCCMDRFLCDTVVHAQMSVITTLGLEVDQDNYSRELKQHGGGWRRCGNRRLCLAASRPVKPTHSPALPLARGRATKVNIGWRKCRWTTPLGVDWHRRPTTINAFKSFECTSPQLRRPKLFLVIIHRQIPVRLSPHWPHSTGPRLCLIPDISGTFCRTGLLQRTTVRRVWRAAASRAVRPERRRATSHWCAAPWSHHADSAATALVARATTSPIQGRCTGLLVSVRQCTDLSGRRVSAHRWHQHAPTPLDRHGDVCCSTVTQHLQRSVFHNGWTSPRLWNSLPFKLRQCDSLGEFKRLLKTHLYVCCIGTSPKCDFKSDKICIKHAVRKSFGKTEVKLFFF